MTKTHLSVTVARVLRAFLEDPGRPRYGLDLMEATGLPSGVLYPALARMRASGWVTDTWEDIDPHVENRPPRRYYLLNPEREEEARQRFAELVEMLVPDREASG